MQDDIPAVGWLIVTTLGALVLGAAIAWATVRYQSWRHGTRLRPTGSSMAADSKRERYARMERKAAAEKRPGDPTATKPRDVWPLAIILGAALALAIAALGVMLVNNVHYDGTSPIAETERR